VYRYYYKASAASEKDCDDLLKFAETLNFEEGLVGGESSLEEGKKQRKAHVHWLEGNSLFVRLVWSYILEFNTHFKLNITGYESPQLTKYKGTGYYNWHQDIDYNSVPTPSNRKLSAVLQLSKPEDYKGCELQLFDGKKEPDVLPIANQGDLIVFRSTEWHRITPITKGSRYSLVLWATGTPCV
jgi:PKHD-type hydroxylase